MLCAKAKRVTAGARRNGGRHIELYPQAGKLFLSEMTKGHFGMSAETRVDYEKFLSVFQPDDRDRILQMGTSPALSGNGTLLTTEYRSVGVEDGKERWIAVRGRMLFDGENRATRLIGFTLDISERKRMEEDLRRRAEELQKIMDVAPLTLSVAHDPDCHEITGNRTANWLAEAA